MFLPATESFSWDFVIIYEAVVLIMIKRFLSKHAYTIQPYNDIL